MGEMVWVFGYGSLVWKTQFPYQRKLVGHVRGFVRRFWWWSEDHRGVPGNPGRVVNLLPGEEMDKVWGLAYEISDEDWEGGVRDQLDHREKGGYSQHRARFYPRNSQDEVWVTLYLGSTPIANMLGRTLWRRWQPPSSRATDRVGRTLSIS